MKRTLSTVFVCLLLATPVWAGYDKGKAAYDRKDYATALREWRPLAEQGDARTQNLLGFMYASGQGVPQDYSEAMRWYRKAAEQDHADAQISLGFMYAGGRGVPQDHVEAKRWWRKAAELGHLGAQYNLGLMYAKGDGVPQDHAEALKWYAKAAAQGYSPAQYNLGFMYANGDGVPQDHAEALKWYGKAAAQSYASAQYNLGLMYAKGDGVPQDYVQAHKWFNLAATQGHKKARRDRDIIEGRITRGQLAEAQGLARSWKPRGHAAAPPAPRAPDAVLVRQRIAIIQRQLASLDYDTGPPSGFLGPKTRAAIRAFEAREGLPVSGTVSERLEAALRSASAAITGKTPPTPRPLKKFSTGSGFFVGPAGHILTNEHVVSKCRELRVADSRKAIRIATDEKIDLALLKVMPNKRGAATYRSGRGIRTGDDVIVAGYPLHGLLSSELNITKGIVSSLAGPGDDRRFIQITAPVQPGNSGGPVLDVSGNVVGVVVARLSAIKSARSTGAMPQNVNFAISEGPARAFLESHDVHYDTARSDKTVPTADIAEKAKGYTVLIECWK